ncbi:MAG TPA: DedA family protein [Ktedonobacteraceae bacterium]|nr:DedA family protein [Ktedonobacteraceae bacterium]
MRWLPILRIRMLKWHTDPLAALISLQVLQDALRSWGYLAVMVFIMIESAGIPFPGETMLLLASFSAATIVPQLHIGLIIAFAALGAIIGDNIGYYIGRTGGRALVERYGRYVFLKPQHLRRAEQFFEKHGNKTVFFGRFIAVLRTWAAFLAGVNNMRWLTFLFYNAVGGILWATIFGTLGFLAGRVFHDKFAQVEQIARNISWISAAVIVAVVAGAYLLIRFRRARGSDAASSSENGKVEQPAGHVLPKDETPQSTVADSSNCKPQTEITPINVDAPSVHPVEDICEEEVVAQPQAKDE